MDVKVNWIKLIWADKKKFIFIDWQFCCDSMPSIDGGPVSIGRWWDFHRRSSEFFSACSWLSSDSLFCYESNWPGLLLTFMGIRILWASTRRPSAQKSPPLVSIDTSRSARPPTAAERNAGVWFVTSVEERKKNDERIWPNVWFSWWLVDRVPSCVERQSVCMQISTPGRCEVTIASEIDFHLIVFFGPSLEEKLKRLLKAEILKFLALV